MKKVMSILLMLIMVLSLSVNAFAAQGGFISSPSGNPTPTVVSFSSNNNACKGELVITSYADRHSLSEALREAIEKAYSDIVNSDDLTKLNAELEKLAASKNIAGKDLAVSDLFDISIVGCDAHDDHKGFEITLDADTLSCFVGLLHLNKDGVWELVTNAEITGNKDLLKFSVDSLSPFAIVVDTSSGIFDAPETGDNSMVYVYAIIMFISASAIVLVSVKSKKQKAQ